MRVIGYLILFLILAVTAAGAWLYSGLYDVAADQAPGKLEEWLLETLRRRSIERRSAGLAVPALDDPARTRRGFELYRLHCVTCHGAPGVWPQEMAMGLNPVPPSLDLPAVQDESDAHLFWVIQNGIKLTGMPAFGALESDEELWSLVAFLRRLPELSPREYQAMAGPRAAPAPEEEGGGDSVEGGEAGSPAEQEGAGEPAATVTAS